MTAGEAVTGGFWRVVPLGDERFGLFRLWESPEDGDEPFGTLTDRDTALTRNPHPRPLSQGERG